VRSHREKVGDNLLAIVIVALVIVVVAAFESASFGTRASAVKVGDTKAQVQ
jgi:hypothetical protein